MSDLFTAARIDLPAAKLPTAVRHQACMAEIVSIIGEEKARELVTKLGGVHRRASEIRGLLVKAIGQEAADTLVERFGPSLIYIPRRLTSPALRRARVLELRAQGKTITEIALATDIGERQVYKILASARQD